MDWINIKDKVPKIIEGTDKSKLVLATDGCNYFLARLYTECYKNAIDYQKGRNSIGWVDDEYFQIDNIKFWTELPKITNNQE